MKPLISIVVTCYNKEAYIGGNLASIHGQTWDNIEVVIVNDGSTDHSLRVIETWLPRFKERGYAVRLIDQKNQGIAGAVQAGLKMVTGEYCCMIDGDDMYERDFAGSMAEALDDRSYEWVFCHYRYLMSGVDSKVAAIDDNAQASWRDDNLFEHYLLQRLRTGPNKFMFRTDYMRRCGIPGTYDGIRIATQEGPLLLPMIAGGGRLGYVPRALYRCIANDGQFSNMPALEDIANHVREEITVWRKTITRLGLPNEKRLLAIARLGEIKGQLLSLRTYPNEDFYRRMAGELLDFALAHLRPTPDITLRRLIEANPMSLIYAMEHVILGMENPFMRDRALGTRVIACGALGNTAGFILPSLRHTPAWKDAVLWDMGARPGLCRFGKPVYQPDYAGIRAEDVVMIMPSDVFAEAELRSLLAPCTHRVMRHHAVLDYLAAEHFSEVYALRFTE